MENNETLDKVVTFVKEHFVSCAMATALTILIFNKHGKNFKQSDIDQAYQQGYIDGTKVVSTPKKFA